MQDVIVTVSPNPSIDRTVTLPGPLVRGDVHRVSSVGSEPGGKGVNVARALTLAGLPVTAVLPAGEHDSILTGLAAQGVRYHAVPVGAPVRTNLAVTEPDGTTTKLNEPGAALSSAESEELAWAVLQRATADHWAVLSGSLPPGLPDSWYVEMTAALRAHGCKVAVDTSDAPLAALAAGLGRAAPDLIKPNSAELASLTGADPELLEGAFAAGDPAPVVTAAAALVRRGVRAVLATLGAAGAVLVEADGAWLATPPPVRARSTVGAGDASLAGYVCADTAGCGPAERLRTAVAFGAAAAALPGSAMPGPDDLHPDDVSVTAVTDALPEGPP